MGPTILLAVSLMTADAASVTSTASASAMIMEPGYVGQAQLTTRADAAPAQAAVLNGRYFVTGTADTVYSASQTLRFARTELTGSSRPAGGAAIATHVIPAAGVSELDVAAPFQVPARLAPGAYGGALAVVVNYN